jgi:recombination protein RecA
MALNIWTGLGRLCHDPELKKTQSDKSVCTVRLAVERDIIHKSGAWFSYKDERIGQGRENTRQYIKDHPEFKEELEAAIRATFQPVETPAEDPDADLPEMPESEFEDLE